MFLAGAGHGRRQDYDALAASQIAVEVRSDGKLRVIATVLPNQCKQDISIDGTRCDSAHARIRVLVKRILRHYGYPPDL